MSQNPIELIGAIFNYAEQEEGTPAELAQSEGLTFVAMDARAFSAFRGGALGDEWVVSRKLNGEFPELNGWPDTGWRFQDEKKAKDAYQKMRAHVMAKLPGAEAQDDRGPERRLHDPEHASGEAFVIDGEEALYLSCDRATEARILEMLTDRLEAYSTRGAAPQKYASYSTQIAPHLIGVGGDGDLAEHVVVAFTPADEQALIAAGLTESVRETDLKPFQLEIPSGILVIAWGRIDGAAYPEAAIVEQLGENSAGPLATPLDDASDGPLAWAIRVRPGTYAVALRWLQTEEGISAMALSHVEAKPLWADQFPRRAAPAPKPAAANAQNAAAMMQQAMAAQAALAGGGGGDPDPVVFAGQPLAKLSDYVKLMKGMQAGDMMGALNAAGIDMMGYGQAAGAWGTKMATDPSLMAKYMAMMSRA
jgi:hypothetical protein